MEQLIFALKVIFHPLLIVFLWIPGVIFVIYLLWNKVLNQSFSTARDWEKVDRKRQKAKEKEEKKKQSN